MTPRPRSVSDGEIFDATARVIGQSGLAQLTIAAVAAEAGLAPSSLVQRFGSKRALLLAFAAGAADGVRRTFAAAASRRASPLATLEEALVALVTPIRSAAEMAHHLAFLQLDASDPEFRQHAVAHGVAFREEAERLIAEATKQGHIAEGDAGRRARTLHVVYNGVLVTWAIHAEGPLEDAVRSVIPLALGLPPTWRTRSDGQGSEA